VTGICQDRVVIVTGAGRGIGREHALEFARQGADVVVNDLGAEVDGTGASIGPAEEVAAEIRAMGRRAVVNGDDVADEQGARNLVDTAVRELGRLDVLVNNAGILRDRMLVNMTFDEWDAVMRVHLRGTFGPTHFAARHWRDRSKAGDEVDARVINTSSPSGLYGNVGQSNYGAAKAGIAAFTIIAARELQRYGVTVNAVAPAAATRMTIPLIQARQAGSAAGTGAATTASAEQPPDAFDPAAPDNIAPIVVWLGSPGSARVTGQVFNVRGGRISLAEGWRRGPAIAKEGRWDPAELDELVPALLAGAESDPPRQPAPPATPATTEAR
jgi:NAD(P)-dependent dehydrogenase (short-subunit alcohol dehydrogenase family)